MKILAIDPGTVLSAFVVYDTEKKLIVFKGKIDNREMKGRTDAFALACDLLVIEMIKSYGNAMGDSVLETCVWIGRFMEAWGEGKPIERIPRKTIVTNVCQNPRAKDSNVRQALIDYFAEHVECSGGGKCKVIGTKAKPGPLYGVSKDIWSALAVAVAYDEIQKLKELTS